MKLTKKQQRLLDAAPEMLAALKQAVKRADIQFKKYHTMAGRTPECQADYDRCVAAIKLATGR